MQAAAVLHSGWLITCVATAALLLPFSEKPIAVSCVTISGLGCGGGAAAGAPAALLESWTSQLAAEATQQCTLMRQVAPSQQP